MNVKRSLPGLRLSRSPLVYVVGQVRIAPIISMAKYLPEMQDQLRKQFPGFTRGIIQEIVIDQENPHIVSSERYHFYDRDQQTTIIVSPESIAVETSKYSVFDSFMETMGFAFETINRCVSIGLVQRIGLRYVDLIKGDTNNFVQSGLHGLDATALGVAPLARRSEFIGQTQIGTLAVRLYDQVGRALPPDIRVVNLKLGIPVESKERISLLDFDHFVNKELEFDAQQLTSTFWSLHDTLDLAFRSAVTPEALKAWGADHV